MSEGEAMRAGAAICPPERRRDALVALAAHAGHRSAGMTATTYLHGWDLRIFEAVARQVARTDYDRVAAGIADRIVKIETSAQSDLWAPADSAPATERRDPVELMATLRLIEKGGTLEAAAVGAQMSRGALEAVVAAARGLAALKSRKGTLRLFPPGADQRLAPHPPRSASEQREGRALMRDLWELRQTRRPDVVWWCAAHLLRATRSNAGLRLICPGEVARWRAVSRQLSPRRWSLHLEGPPGACDRSQWEAACPVATPWRCKAGSKSVAAIIRLPRPDSEDPDSRLREISADYASGAPVFAAHGIAIALKLSAKDMALELRRPNEPGH